MSDDVVILVRVNNQTVQGFRDINGQLRTLDGRFAQSANSMNRSSGLINRGLVDLKATMLSLAPAAVPVAASLAPVAVQMGAGALAAGAFAAALGPQIGKLGDAAKAQTKYSDAVVQYGVGSKQAAAAALAQQQTLSGMPKATQMAAAGYSNLSDAYRDFSDRTAKFTMAPVEKSFVLMEQLLPKLEPMVEGTGTQLDRLMKVAGGAMASPGFDAYAEKVADFSNNVVERAADKVIHFARVLSEGDAHGPIAEFMDYARAQGPAVRELLDNLADATLNILEGASQAGPGILTLVNAFARLLAAAPPELVATLMQVYTASKLIGLTSAGVTAVAGAYGNVAAKIAVMRAASVAAGGGLAGFNAALNTLTTGGKAALAIGVVGGLSLAMHQLSDNKGAVAVDELSTSLNTLVSTGKVTGELKTNFNEISESIAMVSKGASDNKLATMVSDFGTWIGISTGPGISTAKKNVDAWDKSMADLVRSGHPKEAAAQYEILKKAWVAGGGDLKRLKEFTDDYSGAQADQAFELKMAADSMGVFGAAAQSTEATLDAQRESADGLRQSILALNDVNRSAFDAETRFEESLDNLSASFKKNGASLNIHTEAGRANRDVMSQAAKAQDEFIASGVAAGDSLGSMTKKSSELRAEMMTLATEAFDGNKKKATEYVNTLLGAPSEIKTLVKLEREAAVQGLQDVRAAIAATPDAKEVRVSTLNGAAIKALEAVGLKTKQLPDGKTAVYTANGKALGAIGAVSTALNNLDGKTANTYVSTTYTKTYRTQRQGERDYTNSKASGGILEFYAEGGMREQHVAEIAPAGTMRVWAEPETGGEAYIPLAPSKRGRSMAVLSETADRFGYRLEKYASGGMSDAQKQARKDLASSFSISRFGQYAGYKRDRFEKSLGAPQDLSALVSSLNDLRGQIKAAFTGKQEKTLLKNLDHWGKGLIRMQKELASVTKSLEKAKDKLNDLKSSAAQLSSSVKGGILSSANITRGVSGDKPTTVASIMGGLTESRDKATAFASALKQLQKKGLSKALIQQIAEAGIEGGGLETAGALLGASSSEIKSLNSLQSQINKSAGAAGKTTADAVYGAAIKEQTKAVQKLQRSQDKLEKTMAKFASNIEKILKMFLKGKAAGGIVGAAASGGVRSNLTWVGEHGPELLDLPAGSRVWSNPDSRRMAAAPWASMLNTPRGGSMAGKRAAAYPGGGVMRPVEVVINLDGRTVARQLVDPLRGELRVRGIALDGS